MVRRRRGLKVLTTLVVSGGVGLVVATALSASAPARVGAVRHPPADRRLSARRLRPMNGRFRPGTPVHRAHIAERVFSNGRDGFALGWVSSALYPVATVDGGRAWRIDGPWLYREAADAPAVVGQIGLVLPRTFYTYGSSVIDVTPDGGREWWQTFFSGLVVAVVPGSHVDLVAYVQPFGGRSDPRVTYEYATRDGGRHWHYTAALGGG
jgi:hypothetical protein